ncbi:hypothetical protein NBH00_04535 [Paraconexibacter antarcticus]|uniref:Translation initiation factor IF-2 n=1 Tax=Paraconexibacter antarcticus TaxID=2949664 RepID=A0ABY5DY48_9ACTN|nr:hypothetical protein [Paraconexibacter antarcticus]UTI65484.1 hypothetical protein NBH00_04535 [Paraconexibacter antarcticus]
MPDLARLHPRPAPRERTARVRRGLLAASGAVVLAAGLGACGSSAATSTGGAAGTSAAGAPDAGQAGGPGRIFGAARDPKVAACLRKQGVRLPTGRRRPPRGSAGPYGGPGAGPGAGPPPAGAGVPPAGAGTPPAGARRFRRGGTAQFQQLRKALAACGVSVPQAPGGVPGAAAPATPATTTGAPTS